MEQLMIKAFEVRKLKEGKLNPALIDLDLVKGGFTKPKSKHSILTSIRMGILRIMFAPFYYGYWRDHTNSSIAKYIIFHCFLQWLQINIFVYYCIKAASCSYDDILVPVFLSICLSMLHSRITASHVKHSPDEEISDTSVHINLNCPSCDADNSKKFSRIRMRKSASDLGSRLGDVLLPEDSLSVPIISIRSPVVSLTEMANLSPQASELTASAECVNGVENLKRAPSPMIGKNSAPRSESATEANQDTIDMKRRQKIRIAEFVQGRSKRKSLSTFPESSILSNSRCNGKKCRYEPWVNRQNKECRGMAKHMNASETEFDRLNSDVGSDNSYSSDDDCPSHNYFAAHSTPVDSKPKFTIGPVIPAQSDSSEKSKGLDSQADSCIEQEEEEGYDEEDGWSRLEGMCASAPLFCQSNNYAPNSSQRAIEQAVANCTDMISCYIWHKQSLKKFNLTLLDLGCSLIRVSVACALMSCGCQLVDGTRLESGYVKLSVLITMLFSIAPILFHGWCLVPDSNAVFANLTQPIMTNRTFLLSFIDLYSQQDLVSVMFFLPQLIGITLQHVCAQLSLLKLFLVLSGVILRANLFGTLFFFYTIAERTFQQRLLYAKYFTALTSSRRARKYRVPHLRLNKVAHIKCWLTLRSYIRKCGPQRSIDTIVAAAFYSAFLL
ncbi:hypothetical protein Ciccas_010603, partial [Cichlidogyrus casuarinus]